MRAYVDCSDKRSESIKDSLKQAGYCLLSKNLIKDCSLVYLGMQGDKYSDQDFMSLADVYTLCYHPAIEKQCELSNAKYHYLSNDKDFVYQNTLFTIEGLIGYLITNEKQSIHDNTYLILGYGNLGKQAYKVLKALDACVYVATDNIEEHFQLQKDAILYSLLSCCYPRTITVIINTIPAPVISLENDNVKIYDLASKPYGLNELISSLSYQQLSSLPTYYHTPLSGKMIANTIMKRDDLIVNE